MDNEITEAIEALFESNFQQTARIEALEVTLSALISNIATLHPFLSDQLPEILTALAKIRAAQIDQSESTAAFNEQIAKQQSMIKFVTAK